ncbi:MAG: BatD family protein [Paludibacteraceae bacterium]|nr:BatD family protein [Paludibacteraceae bacterium]
MKKIVLILLSLTIACFNVLAEDDVNIKATAPNVVGMGQQFRLEFHIRNAKPSDLQIPELTDFDVLMGPSTSQASQISIVNGNMTKTENTTYTYVLTPKREGTFTISPARFTHNGKTIMSNALTIKVDSKAASSQQNSSNVGGNNQVRNEDVGLSDKDIFCVVEYSKKKVYEGEQLVATVKLYHKGNVTGFDEVKLPEYNGFIAQEINIDDKDRNAGIETYNGDRYYVYIIKKSILFPQRAGTINIENGKMTIIAQIQRRSNRRRSFWDMDDFFSTTQNVKKNIIINGSKIEVMALPQENRPADFNGAVGSYKIESSINSTEVKSNDPVNVKIKISGTGNIKYIKNPEIKFPNDFEIYDPTVDTKVNTSGNVVSGSKTIEYLTIPRYAGTYEIPSVTFSYFDPKTKKYNTLKTEAYTLHVEKGEKGNEETTIVGSNFSSKENVKYLGQDIHFINTKDKSLKAKTTPFFGSTAYYLWFIIPLCLFITLFILYRKQLKENSNLVLVKNKRANKQATKRLKQANIHLQANEKELFYEEVSKALLGYTSDKLNIPMSELDKDNIEMKLTDHNVAPQTIKNFMDILQTCEFARFAPSESHEYMDDLYNKTVDLIGLLEEQIKK